MEDGKALLLPMIGMMLLSIMSKLLPKKPEEPPVGGAATGIRVLGLNGEDVTYVDLEPGDYTIEITVTNQSLQYGEPAAAIFKTYVEAFANDTELLSTVHSVDEYGPDEEKVLIWPLHIHEEIPASYGMIVARVFDINEVKRDEVGLPIELTGPRREAVDGMGDLNGDGYVSAKDMDILRDFIHDDISFKQGTRPLSDITPADITLYEFYRRADLNCDTNIDIRDVYCMMNFIHTGSIPEPTIGSREALPNSLGDLNDDGYVSSIDLVIHREVGLLSRPLVLWSPLTIDEFIRRADVNADGVIDTYDWDCIHYYIIEGEMPVDYAAQLGIGVTQ